MQKNFKREILLIALLSIAGISLSAGETETTESAPLIWVQPDTFSPVKPGLGLPVLQGIKHSILYDPKPSNADPATGGNGRYESLLNGTYNHHQQFLIDKDKVIVYWTNHVQDENGPGQRVIAKVGTIHQDGLGISWGGDETLVEIEPPAMPAKRRQADNNSDAIDSAFLDGEMSLVDGKILFRGRILACDGWTDDMQYHNSTLNAPVPDEHYRSGLDKQAGFKWDIYWFLGNFVQQFDFVDGTLKPISPVYIAGTPVPPKMQITPSKTKKVALLNSPYKEAKSLNEAPAELRETIARADRGRTPWQGYPHYAKGSFKLAANGKNGLAHMTEFHRPDGKYVIIRDNLLDSAVYYAAVKEKPTDFYPPAVRTNLFGTAMPVAGSLPDGSVWIIGSNRDRTDMFLTLSKDGKTFDKSWLLLHLREKVREGVSKSSYGGPQYFQAITVGNSIWTVYSIGKEKIGMTEIPFASLTN